jgi:hypothetical protein
MSRTKGSKTISSNKFEAIAEDLRNHPRLSIRSIAESHYVSYATVRKVNRSVNYLNFKRGYDTKYTIREQLERDKQRSKVAEAKAEGFNPQTREDRAAKKLAKDLQSVGNQPSREEFEILKSRLDVISAQQIGLLRNPLFHSLFGKSVSNAIDELIAREGK